MVKRQLCDVPDESVWAKLRGLDPSLPPYPLVRHLLDAAAMALCLWDRYLSESQRQCIAAGLGLADDREQTRALVGLCAGLHDIGKLSGFQFCDSRGRALLGEELVRDPGKIGVEELGHDVAGMTAAPAVLAALGFDDSMTELGAVDRVAEIIGGHHGRFFRLEREVTDTAHYQALLGGRAWARQRAAHAATVFKALRSPRPPTQFKAPAAVLVTGVVILADWLVSQEHFLARRQRRLNVPLERHFAEVCVEAEHLVREAGLLPAELERKPFAEAYGIDGEPNPLQRSIAQDLAHAIPQREAAAGKAGILLVTAAPGDGKSETALEAERVLSSAFGTRGFVFLLPTMATSDQMYGRVTGMLARQNGSRAGLTLIHSMAWLSSAYGDDDLKTGSPVLVCEGEDAHGGQGRDPASPGSWLRGAKRPLLAQYAVGTVDQALMAVLPVRHNALRLLALSGKTVIVDEAHAYDPYMQVLLGRLLNWLGAYGVPVILLSATLPASVSDRLIKEYLLGAGHRAKDLAGQSFKAPYPGWLYVDAQSATEGKVSSVEMSKTSQAEQTAQRSMTLRVQVEPVADISREGTGGRLAVIERCLQSLVTEGGCALVVCNTVGEAQATYTRLRARFERQGLGADDLQLLHARFPGDVREARTRAVTSGMGRTGPRPQRRIIVATQVVEQSLDLDADVVISDLAPLALLLQRAGRCWRHETWWAERARPGGRPRPAWAAEAGPRLVVLDPLAANGKVPKQWGTVYAEFLLMNTSQLLAQERTRSIRVPADVQDLVEEVHGHRADQFDWEHPERSAAWSAYAGEDLAHRAAGNAVVIPQARRVRGLRSLHHLNGTEDEWRAATRLGADSVRLLCVYGQEDGTVTLDASGAEPLPVPAPGARMARDDVRRVMGKTIPVRADWFQGQEDAHRPPDAWSDHPMLGDLMLLTQPVRDGRARAVQVGRKRLWLDEDLGLVCE
ncbi:CRISPR-associated helicase Cas3' [Streptomyces sp. NPDC048518]|uniref:CRISPR-associated helicase Cas3' n=1 Tax=Streptomyces sp. NPDC048518 TaxID=3155029 RepID=UPI0033E56302